jgi:hypothetical protein
MSRDQVTCIEGNYLALVGVIKGRKKIRERDKGMRRDRSVLLTT